MKRGRKNVLYAWAMLAIGLCALSEPRSTIVATVDGRSILLSDVERLVPSGQQISAELLPRLRAEALEQLIDRQLLEKALKKSGITVTDDEVKRAVARLGEQLQQQQQSLDQLLAERRLDRKQLDEEIAYELRWSKYVERQLTDEFLSQYFNDHRKQYDGTLVRVRHVLMRPQRAGDPGALAELVESASKLYEQIKSGKTSFESAVERHSDGPSREQGGDLGFIPRHGIMVEPFARAAFELKKGEVSRPVMTSFGVHLIQVTAIKPGTKQYGEVRETLRPAAAEELRAQVVREMRPASKIEFSGAMPHYRPGTKKLVQGTGK